jgi:putative transposase
MILLAGLKAKKKVKKSSPGQMRLPWDEWEATNEEIENVACKLLSANCYNPDILHHSQQPPQNEF